MSLLKHPIKSNKRLSLIISVIVVALLALSIIGTIVAKFVATKVINAGIEKLTDGKVNIDTNTGETTIKRRTEMAVCELALMSRYLATSLRYSPNILGCNCR